MIAPVTLLVLMFPILLCGNQDEKTKSKEVVKIEKKMSRISPEVAADAAYSAGLDETLVIIHKEEVLFIDTDGKEIAKIKGLRSLWRPAELKCPPRIHRRINITISVPSPNEHFF